MSGIDNKANPSADGSDAVGLTENIRHFAASRREMFVTTLGVAGVFGASQMLTGIKDAHVATEEFTSSKFRIDPRLTSALQFDREQSRNPGAVFLFDKGLLVGFADNFYHHDLATDISQGILRWTIAPESIYYRRRGR